LRKDEKSRVTQATAGPGQPRTPIVFYGAGSLALVLSEFVDANGYRLVAILSDYAPARAPALPVPLVTGSEAIDRWLIDIAGDPPSYAIAIGNQHHARLARHRLLREKGLAPASLIHPTSFISPSATIGAACQVMAFAFVGAAARLGDACIVKSHASVDHECRLGNSVYVGPGAVLAGEVEVGDCAAIGAGAVILPGVSIPADAIIGAGAVVTRSIEAPGTYVGVPARRRD
jgi:sugar O-acyltransferase (sialic acid O-acetyltransferase NeuD family)